VGLRQRVLLLVVASAAVFASNGVAHAASPIQPAAGATTGTQPLFVVTLDAQDTLPQITVASSPDVSATGAPAQPLGACTPTTAGAQAGTESCVPSSYASTGTPALAPGTYYWWLAFTPDGGTAQSAGPFAFTVVQATPPADAFLVGPADKSTSDATPKLTVHAPTGAGLHLFVSTTPTGAARASCSGTSGSIGDYTCQVGPGILAVGSTYYWGAVVTTGTSSFVYGPRSFTVGANTTPPAKPAPKVHDVTFAPQLPSSAHYVGKSVKQTRLSEAAYGLSKVIGAPKSIAVACWSEADWENISGENPESGYTILGFHLWAMPHWVDLSPGICRTFETLLYHRPRYANVVTANALDTLTHEMIHALGIHNEAETECFAMQLSFVTGVQLGLPLSYAENLDRLSLRNYFSHPPNYVDTKDCREGGAWDLFKSKPSLPWHMTDI